MILIADDPWWSLWEKTHGDFGNKWTMAKLVLEFRESDVSPGKTEVK